ncbi:hypothetical protein GQ43DRAFT_450596 [Delitschia confertaspora ATCC 74209]|uniref:BTB domain-containing protein n=1 Tax=Delitschia confertaspora ATCC 74209 TaxID=1513339 RepID=A0A9P4JIQ1_9PLEO|nr:hypothetical protein GQ43DRAFT_450596 [Delitschia confertaspora ATCC 74209]
MDFVTIQVDERKFSAQRHVFAESQFLSEVVAIDIFAEEPQNMRRHFYNVDADPVLFEHIVRYLRRGVLPIFYDESKGHDYAMYVALLEEARYFGIPRLITWLENNDFLKAVSHEYITKEIYKIDQLSTSMTGRRTADVNVTCIPTWTKNKIYVCPRGIPVHRGNRHACGRACNNAKGEAKDVYDEEMILRAVVVERRTVFDGEACVEGVE